MKRIKKICLLISVVMLLSGCSTVKEVENQDFSYTYNSKTYEGTYTGTIEDNQPNGLGKFVSGQEGDDSYLIYDGNWENGVIKGEGSLVTNNYTVHFPETETVDPIDRVGTYNGSVIDGIANGQGSFKAVNKNGKEYIYEGDWSDGLYNGQGKREFPGVDGLMIEKGKFTDGTYTPTLVQYITALGTMTGYCPYTVSKEAKDFIKENKSLFTKHKGDKIDSLISDDFSMDLFKRSPQKQEPCFIRRNGLTIIQAFESHHVPNIDSIHILATDYSDEYYFLEYIGDSDKLIENNAVNIVFMPLGFSTYDLAEGGQQWAVSGVIVTID